MSTETAHETLQPAIWLPYFLEGEALFTPGDKVPTTRQEYQDLVDPDLVSREIDGIKRNNGEVPEGVDRVVSSHLGRLKLLHTLGEAVIQAPDRNKFKKYYLAMSNPENIEPAGLRGSKGAVDKREFMDVYPDGFRQINIESGLTLVISGYALRNPQDAPEVARIDIRRKKTLVKYGTVKPGLPATRAFAERVEDGYEPNAEALLPLASSLQAQLDGDNLKKSQRPSVINQLASYDVQRMSYELDLDDAAQLDQVESAIVDYRINARSDVFNHTGMNIAARLLNKAAASGQKNARTVKNELDEQFSLSDMEMTPEAFVSTANKLTDAMKFKKTDSLLATADKLEAFDLPRAIDRIMFATFSVLKNGEEASNYQKAGNIASLLAVMGVDRIGDRTDTGSSYNDVLSPQDVAFRYWDFSESTRKGLARQSSQKMDQIVVHDKLLKN